MTCPFVSSTAKARRKWVRWSSRNASRSSGRQRAPESPYNLFYLQGLNERVQPNDWQCSFAPDTGNHDSASALIAYEAGLHAVYTQHFYTRRGAAARAATLVG